MVKLLVRIKISSNLDTFISICSYAIEKSFKVYEKLFNIGMLFVFRGMVYALANWLVSLHWDPFNLISNIKELVEIVRLFLPKANVNQINLFLNSNGLTIVHVLIIRENYPGYLFWITTIIKPYTFDKSKAIPIGKSHPMSSKQDAGRSLEHLEIDDLRCELRDSSQGTMSVCMNGNNRPESNINGRLILIFICLQVVEEQ